MVRPTIPIDFYVDASRVFHWATMRHYQLWFTGQEKTRHRRTESVLKRLATKGRLRAIRHGGKLIYTARRFKDEFSGLGKVEHGLACTECLVRFYRSRVAGTPIPERHFAGMGAVPEWGILYPTGTMLLLEFCTRHNFYFSGNMRSKLAAYRQHLGDIAQHFNAHPVVVFVADVTRHEMKRYVTLRLHDYGPYFFTDYETFLKVPVGGALASPIYIWASDGAAHPLRNDVQLEDD